METIKNILFGLLYFGSIALVLFIWVWLPFMLFSYPTPEGTHLSLPGVVWIFTPVVIILLFVCSWIGASIRGKS